MELLCAACVEVVDAKVIREYAGITVLSRPASLNLGNHVAARPDHDQSWWQHTCGDWAWWVKLPMYQDQGRELARLKIERDHYYYALARFREKEAAR